MELVIVDDTVGERTNNYLKVTELVACPGRADVRRSRSMFFFFDDTDPEQTAEALRMAEAEYRELVSTAGKRLVRLSVYRRLDEHPRVAVVGRWPVVAEVAPST